MITVPRIDYHTSFLLSDLFRLCTKDELQKFADKIDVYLPHSYNKDRQANCLSESIREDPLNTLRLLSKKEMDIVKQIISAGKDRGIKVKKMPKTLYTLQKLALVASFMDDGNNSYVCSCLMN